MAISSRNRLRGHVTEIDLGVAHVTISVGTGTIESILARPGGDEIDLKQGDQVEAVVQTAEVTISKETSDEEQRR